MSDFKATYDAVNAAVAEVNRLVAEMDDLMKSGDEGVKQALDMRPALDEAEKKANDLMDIYARMKSASTRNVVEMFVPAAQTTPKESAEEKPDVMKLAEFHNLAPQERMAFVKAGGKIE